MSKSKAFIVAALALGVTSGVNAQQQPPAPPQLPQAPNMTFFVTGAGPGKGADLGGIEGADQHCQHAWQQRHGAGGKTWRAYLSTPGGRRQAGSQCARPRSATARGRTSRATVVATSVDDLHSDNNKLSFDNSLSERGFIIPGVGFAPNRHDVLTGLDHRKAGAFPAARGSHLPQLDEQHRRAPPWSVISTSKGLRDDAASRGRGIRRIRSRGDPTAGCSQSDLRGTGGDGLFYCFATPVMAALTYRHAARSGSACRRAASPAPLAI